MLLLCAMMMLVILYISNSTVDQVVEWISTIANKLFSGYRLGLSLISIGVGLTVMMVTELVQLERLRDTMKRATGDGFEDNHWGFGQVIAIFLWVPFVGELVQSLGRCLFERGRRANTERGEPRLPNRAAYMQTQRDW